MESEGGLRTSLSCNEPNDACTDKHSRAKGMLQAGRDRLLIDEIDEQLGMRELCAKVNGKAGLGPKDVHNRFSIHAENLLPSKVH